MCKFFSFVSDGNGNVFYFDVEDRKTQETPDSHTTIAEHFFKEIHADDHVNKYEFVRGKFIVDQINIKDDSEQVEKWIQSFSKTKHFYNMCVEMVRQKISIRDIPEEFCTPELCELSVRQDGSNFQYVPEKLRTPDLCELAVRQYGGTLYYVPEKFKTSELCRLAVKQCSHALAYVPEKFKTSELCRLAKK